MLKIESKPPQSHVHRAIFLLQIRVAHRRGKGRSINDLQDRLSRGHSVLIFGLEILRLIVGRFQAMRVPDTFLASMGRCSWYQYQCHPCAPSDTLIAEDHRALDNNSDFRDCSQRAESRVVQGDRHYPLRIECNVSSVGSFDLTS